MREQVSPYDFALEIRRKSGEVRQIGVSAEMIEINHKPCSLAIVSEITARKQTEVALREKEELEVRFCYEPIHSARNL